MSQPMTNPRSMLHALQPYGEGTPHVESLLSYFCRLAASHSVSTLTLSRTIAEHFQHQIAADFDWHERQISGIRESGQFRGNENPVLNFDRTQNGREVILVVLKLVDVGGNLVPLLLVELGAIVLLLWAIALEAIPSYGSIAFQSVITWTHWNVLIAISTVLPLEDQLAEVLPAGPIEDPECGCKHNFCSYFPILGTLHII